MTTEPSRLSLEPSSLVIRKEYEPSAGALRLARTVDWKLSLAPKSASVDQLIVGMSLSTFGVCPLLSVHVAVGPVPSWYVRSVTPGSWGGVPCACAGALIPAARPKTATAVDTAPPIRRRESDLDKLPDLPCSGNKRSAKHTGLDGISRGTSVSALVIMAGSTRELPHSRRVRRRAAHRSARRRGARASCECSR